MPFTSSRWWRSAAPRAAEALDLLDASLANWPRAHVAPEALYWSGVAAYRVTHALPALADRWGELARRFPGSEWALRVEAEVSCHPERGEGPEP